MLFAEVRRSRRRTNCSTVSALTLFWIAESCAPFDASTLSRYFPYKKTPAHATREIPIIMIEIMSRIFKPLEGRRPGATGCFGTNEVGIDGERATSVVYGVKLERDMVF